LDNTNDKFNFPEQGMISRAAEIQEELIRLSEEISDDLTDTTSPEMSANTEVPTRRVEAPRPASPRDDSLQVDAQIRLRCALPRRSDGSYRVEIHIFTTPERD
jgi:hypothetical protein